MLGCGSGAATVKKQMTPAQLALGDPVVNSVGMLLVPIPAGEFQMGSLDIASIAAEDT
jgi:formylglycine-generating enzyme required for sulfatase activity